MENTPRSLASNELVRHSTPSLSFDKNDSNPPKSSPKALSSFKLNPSAPIFKPKLQFLADPPSFQPLPTLLVSSQLLLRQSTQFSPLSEPSAQVYVHDTPKATFTHPNIPYPSSSPNSLLPTKSLSWPNSKFSSSNQESFLAQLQVLILHFP